MAARDLVGAQHRLAGLGRDKRHELAHLWRSRDVVEPRQRARRLAEGDVRSHVLDALAVDEHLPSIVEGAKIIGASSHRRRRFARLLGVHDLMPSAISSTSFCGVTGLCAMYTPNGCNASSIAEITAAAAAMLLASPDHSPPIRIAGSPFPLQY